MIFSAFGPFWIVGGGLVLLGILYLLQRLSPQRRVVHLPAAPLWLEAVREVPMRVRGARFRYWLAYLLAAGIVLSLWLAAAHPERTARMAGGVQQFYLDNSAVLARKSDFAAAKRALLADVRATAPENRAVYLGDATATPLLLPGESASLLSRRLDGIAAALHPSLFNAWLSRSANEAGGQAVTVHYYGAAASRDALRLPDRVKLRYGYLAPAVPGNRGITAFGARPAASGRWSRVDVEVALASANGSQPSADALRWTLDGKPWSPTGVEPIGDGSYMVRDVPSAGGMLHIALERGDGFPADDEASLRLPDRRPLRVALLDGTPAMIRAAVAADDSLEVAARGDAQVVVGNEAAVAGTMLPAFVISDPGSQAQTFAFAGPGEGARGDLSARLDAIGLSQIDAAALADALGRPIGVDVSEADRRRVAVWRAVFDPQSTFARSAEMPLFVARGLRWLGGVAPSAGGPVTATGSLTDRATTLAAAQSAPAETIRPVSAVLPPDILFMLLLLIAGGLLAIEWWLFQRGMIP